ncbi:hypothetical protein OsI_05544 [Oryza sativa Indica Group]|uniref:Uncharacterized protein n=1 Tax=Oryza sativa subsp. indica TaxID=39946 RepID=B8AGJ9_ORYSI|nr:hypothetical protein OsI_05544 [Oryza sativa Indica Group]
MVPSFPQPASAAAATRPIPGSYGPPLLGPLRDRLDYFWFQGPDDFFRRRAADHKSTVFRANIPPTFPFFLGVDPRVVAVVDAAAFTALFDPALVDKRDVLIGPYVPSLAFTRGTRVGVYLDTQDPDHARTKAFSIDLLRRAARNWAAELRAAVDDMLAAVEEDLNRAPDPAAASASYLIPLQKCIFRFLCKALVGADPAADGLVDRFGVYILDVWLALQLVPTQKVGVIPQPLEELLLHSFPLPSFVVKPGMLVLIPNAWTEWLIAVTVKLGRQRSNNMLLRGAWVPDRWEPGPPSWAHRWFLRRLNQLPNCGSRGSPCNNQGRNEVLQACNYMQYYSFADNMAPSNLITALTPKNDRWRIKVKVIRLWDAVNPTMVDEFYGIQMIVLDAETCLYLDVIGLLSGMKPIEQRMLGKNTSRERVCNMREIELLLLEHNAEKVLPTMIEVDASTQGTIEEQMFYNRKTLKEITELRYSNIQQKSKLKLRRLNQEIGGICLAISAFVEQERNQMYTFAIHAERKQ